MKFGREARILTLLVIDTVFFFVEIIVGYYVGSLALVADSFHMLNDVISLVVALYAIKLATSPSNSKNSYGWQRAEILGALINGVFLLALCLSIFLEAIERFFNVQEISNAKLVVIVGSLGLASNIVGLFLFHEHGHSHGGGGHSHSHGDEESQTTTADATPHSHHHATAPRPISPSRGPSEPAQARSKSVGRHRADSLGSLYGHPAQTRAAVIETAQEFGYGRSAAFSPPSGSVMGEPATGYGSVPNAKEHGPSSSHSRSHSKPNNSKSYAAAASNGTADTASSSTVVGSEQDGPSHVDGPKQKSSSAARQHNHTDSRDKSHSHAAHADSHDHSHVHDHADDHDHDHSHEVHSSGGGGGHSHGNMNMRGVFLHVMGDALGNIGVIAAGLVIIFAEGRWKYYFDPAISLLITVIIFSSALPLVKSASFILLQGVPGNISLDAVKRSISIVDGVISVHELHVWQLSEKTIVASVHVLVSRDRDYMAVANGIRQALHEHGVHSSTIQPEFTDGGVVPGDSDDEAACLIRCDPEACGGDTCCPPTVGKLVDVEDETEGGDEAAAFWPENVVRRHSSRQGE